MSFRKWGTFKGYNLFCSVNARGTIILGGFQKECTVSHEIRPDYLFGIEIHTIMFSFIVSYLGLW